MTGTVREYLYAGGEAPTAMRSRNSDGSYSNFFFVTNTHGDVVALTDRDGNIVNRYAYGPWGEATRVSEQVHQPFRYAGYRYEDGFDLYYLRARWYDASTGRFLSRDPVRGNQVKPLTLNRYAYAESCPASLADPTGLSPIPCRQGIYVLAEHIDSMYETHVKGRPNDATNVGHMMDAIYGVFGGPGNTNYSLFSEKVNGERLFSQEGNTGWRKEFVDEPDPTHHFVSFLYYGWLDETTLFTTAGAYAHEAEPYFAGGTGGTQEDYRLSKAAAALGSDVRLGASVLHRWTSPFSGWGIKASELGSEVLNRFSSGNCKDWIEPPWTPFF